MSKRKLATRTRRTVKAQRSTQAIVRSPKASAPRSVGLDSNAQPSEPREDLQQDVLLIEDRQPFDKKPEAALHDPERIRETDLKKGSDFLSAAREHAQAYQAKLLEIVQANVQLAYEFSQRLAAIRSPVDFPIVIAEFTSKRISMFRKHSKELAELSTRRWAS
jgi:hypothetical protein